MKKIEIELHEDSENRVLKDFAKRMNIKPKQIIQHNKNRRISEVRQLYCKLRYEKHGASYEELGLELGRTHGTVRYGVYRINELLCLNDKRIIDLWNRVRDISELPGREG